MKQEAKDRLMDKWRADLRQTNYFESVSIPRWDEYGVDEWFASAHFRARVMLHLRQQGWRLKEIAWIWKIRADVVWKILANTKLLAVASRQRGYS